MRTKSIIVVAALTLAACSKHEEQLATPSAVETAIVREVASGNALRYSATIEPDTQVAIAFRVSGYVETVAVEEGAHVTKGTVLARIRTSDYAEKLGQASASHSEAQAALAQAQSDLARARTLFAANALTKPELDAAIANVDVNQARVQRGRAAAGEANLALRDTSLIAPIDGVILRRAIEPGDLGTPGATAFILANTRTVKVMFGAPDTMIASLRVGQTIDVTTESMPDRVFHANVARLSPAADPKTRAFDIELHIDNSDGSLKPGMVASLAMSNGAAPMLAVPLDAVVRPAKSNEGYAVYVIVDGKAKARSVELGEPMGNLVALKRGLSRGEQVVVSGPALLVDGQSVRVVNVKDDGGSDAR